MLLVCIERRSFKFKFSQGSKYAVVHVHDILRALLHSLLRFKGGTYLLYERKGIRGSRSLRRNDDDDDDVRDFRSSYGR